MKEIELDFRVDLVPYIIENKPEEINVNIKGIIKIIAF